MRESFLKSVLRRSSRLWMGVGPPVAGGKAVSLVAATLLAAIFLGSCTYFRGGSDIYWGSVPDKKAIRMLKSLGIKSVVNCRTNSEKGTAAYARSLGMGFYHINTGVIWTPEEAELRKFLSIVCDPKNRPVFVCCNIGIDRTSYYVAAYRVAVQGWTVEQARDEMLAHGVKQWWPTFREYDDSLRANEAFMRRVAREYGCVPEKRTDTAVCPCVKLEDYMNGKSGDAGEGSPGVKEAEAR